MSKCRTGRRIPVTLVRVDGKTEVSMDFEDFESSDVNIGDDVRRLKEDYVRLVEDVRPVVDGKNKPTTTERWLACRRLADFVDRQDRFEITNFDSACARDVGVSGSFRLMIAFGREFEQHEVFDTIPYTSYRLLVLKKAELECLGIFESEKASLVGNKKSLNPKDYEKYLAGLRA